MIEWKFHENRFAAHLKEEKLREFFLHRHTWLASKLDNFENDNFYPNKFRSYFSFQLEISFFIYAH